MELANPYSDMKKFITNPDKREIVNESEIYISGEEDYDIVICIEIQQKNRGFDFYCKTYKPIG